MRQGGTGMKGRILKLCVFLLAGAIVNVAVAWGCSLATSRPTTVSPKTTNSVPIDGIPLLGALFFKKPAYGKPFASFTCSRESPKSYLGGSLRLSVEPLWPGFAINTVFYAIVLSVL